MKYIITLALILICTSFTPQQPTEFKFTFTSNQVQLIYNAIQNSKGISSADANDLLADINKQIQSQLKVDSTNNKNKKP